MTVRDRDNGAQRLLQIVRQRPRVKVGIVGPQAQASKKGAGSGTATLAEVAAFHEFGAGVPRRSFIADWADLSEADAIRRLTRVMRHVIKNNASLADSMDVFGHWAVGEIQERISQGISPELSEARKAQKRVNGLSGDTPLIHTGQLRSSITHRTEIDG